jgi:hypothetical protein
VLGFILALKRLLDRSLASRKQAALAASSEISLESSS